LAPPPSIGRFAKVKIAISGVQVHYQRFLQNVCVWWSNIAEILRDQDTAYSVAVCVPLVLESVKSFGVSGVAVVTGFAVEAGRKHSFDLHVSGARDRSRNNTGH